jgi:hypothetical protein
MQAIQCKYLSATNSKGSRIKASCASGSITISYPHELSGQAVFRAAADALVIKMQWQNMVGDLLGGQLPDNSYVFVFNNNASKE